MSPPALQRAPALVLLHGFGLDARMWRPQVDDLGDDHRVMTIDLPGFGPQVRTGGQVDPAASVLQAMDVQQLARAHLVGHFYGAAVAIDLALRAPARVASLTLVAPLLLGRPIGIASWDRCTAFARDDERTKACETWLEERMFDVVRQDEDLFDEVRAMVLDYPGGHWTGAITAHFEVKDPAEHLREIGVSSLVISGDCDSPSVIRMAETYAASLKDARRHLLRGAGHLVNLEVPDVFNALLREHVAAAH